MARVEQVRGWVIVLGIVDFRIDSTEHKTSLENRTYSFDLANQDDLGRFSANELYEHPFQCIHFLVGG